jgi:hypothetical protein
MAGTPQVVTKNITLPGHNTVTVPVFAASAIANADELTNYTPGFPFEVEKVDFVTVTPITTAGKTATLTPYIDGVAVPGTLTALAGTQAKGAVANVFKQNPYNILQGTATSTIRLTASAVTAFTEGAGYWLITLRDLGGLD